MMKDLLFVFVHEQTMKLEKRRRRGVCVCVCGFFSVSFYFTFFLSFRLGGFFSLHVLLCTHTSFSPLRCINKYIIITEVLILCFCCDIMCIPYWNNMFFIFIICSFTFYFAFSFLVVVWWWGGVVVCSTPLDGGWALFATSPVRRGRLERMHTTPHKRTKFRTPTTQQLQISLVAIAHTHTHPTQQELLPEQFQ